MTSLRKSRAARAESPAKRPDPKPLRLPALATDTHVHVFDPVRFPFAPDTPYQPIAAELASAHDLAAMLDAAGIERVVLVNPTSGYGDDNRCMLDALERLGPRARGIARVPLDVSSRRLDALARRSVVGVRVDFIVAGLAPLSDTSFVRLLTRLADRDLVLDVQTEGDQFARIAKALAGVPVRVAVDHLSRPRPEQGVGAPGFRALLGMAGSGRVAVKLSGPMRCSRETAPYRDLDPFLAVLLREFSASRLVWGSDWPFLRSDRRLDYGPMLAWLARAVPRASDRRAILATTPGRWFGFADTARTATARG
jgi:predicted TIM-barrel fold metal-dependent hydrolase